MHAENLGRILLDKTRNSGAENYGILIRLSADWMGKVDYESEIFLIQRYITLWKGTTASVDIISLSSKLFHDSCFKPAERRKYFFRYSVYVGENSFDLKQVAIISAETCQMVLNLILAGICIEKNWGDEKILVIPVTWQISAQPLQIPIWFWSIRHFLIRVYLFLKWVNFHGLCWSNVGKLLKSEGGRATMTPRVVPFDPAA